MPRKLCWIEVDEEGKAVGPIDYSGIGISVQRAVVNALPDATEEVVEAMAKVRHDAQLRSVLMVMDLDGPAWESLSDHDKDVGRECVRKSLTRLASAPPTPEKP